MRKNNTASLLLIEIIFAVFFFALASTVCVRFYLRAHTLSTQAGEKTGAVILSQTMAECFLSAQGDAGECAALLKSVPGFESAVYDSVQNRITFKKDESLTAVLSISGADDSSETGKDARLPALKSCDIMVFTEDEDAPILEFPLQVFVPAEEGGAHAQE